MRALWPLLHLAIATSTPQLIIDTDIGAFVDDVGAICSANALQDLGEAEIIAVVHDTGFIKGVGGISALLGYYRRATVPLGAYKGIFGRAPTHGNFSQDTFLSDLIDHFSPPISNATQVPTALEIYRRALAQAPDGAVRIASIGMTTNLRDLLMSGPDEHSPLHGKELIARKVNTVAWMDGMYNFGCAEHDIKPGGGYLGSDAGCRGSAAAAVAEIAPHIQQLFVSPDVCRPILSGDALTRCSTAANPCRQAYVEAVGEGRGFSSCDSMTVLAAVRGVEAAHLLKIEPAAKLTIAEGGEETWMQTGGAPSNQSRLALRGDPNASAISISRDLNDLLCRSPQAQPASARTTTTSMLDGVWYSQLRTSHQHPALTYEPDRYTYLDNGVIRVGVDLTRGGSIGFLADSKDPSNNVINCHDMGREVQLSFYAPPNPYNPSTSAYPDGACDHLFMNTTWPWNPIGAGDIDGNHGSIISVSHPTNTSIHVVTRPLQWACHNVACDCTFEQTISLDGTPGGTGVRVTATLHNDRADAFEPKLTSQELPAVYSIGKLYHLVSYNGTAPWTGAPTVEYATDPLQSPPWHPGFFQATEHWAALLDDSGWGMGVVNSGTNTFLGGFAGPPGSGGPTDNPTGYIAPVDQIALPAKGDYSYSFHLVLGNLATIRSYASQIVPH